MSLLSVIVILPSFLRNVYPVLALSDEIVGTEFYTTRLTGKLSPTRLMDECERHIFSL